MEATISYDKMTQEDFDRGLRNILTMTSSASLLSISKKLYIPIN